MRLPLSCPKCSAAAVAAGTHPNQGYEAGSAAMRDARITTRHAEVLKCAHGHESFFQFQNSGHALLFERALQRLAAHDLRDALLDAHTALEMALGHVLIRARFDRTSESPALIRGDLESVLKNGEATRGAALGVVSVLTGKAPPKIPSSMLERRNKATHAGAYPTEADAESHCLEVERIIGEFDDALTVAAKKPSTEYAVRVFHEEVGLLWGRVARPDLPRVTIFLNTVLDEQHVRNEQRASGHKMNATTAIAEYRARGGNWIS